MATSTVDLQDLYTFLNFLINKFLGAFYAPEQCDLLVDRSQMELYNRLYKIYGAGQRLNDSLSPFKRNFTFTQATSPAGLIQPPDDYYNLLSVIPIIYDSILKAPRDVTCPVVNEDEIVAMENSQLIPNNTTNPFCVIGTNWTVQLYPKIPQVGTIFYLCRPATPDFVYTNVGRTITYNQDDSTQLEWADKDVGDIIVIAMEFLGVNLRAQDIVGWAQNKEQRLALRV